MSRYRSSRAEQAYSPVTLLCRALGVARSGYDAWARDGVSARARADEELNARIVAAHARSRATYGAPQVHAELRARTTVVDPARLPAPNLVARDFAAPTTNRLWADDITYVPTHGGWLYLAVLLDAHSRRVIGWAMAEHLRAELALDALTMALTARRPGAGLIHHTDRGCQYTAAAYQEALAAPGLIASMSRSGDCYGNALAERFFATPKGRARQHAALADARCRPSGDLRVAGGLVQPPALPLCPQL